MTNFAHYMAPVPNLWVLADNMAFLKENGVTDLRLQGNRQSPSGEMGSLRAYLSSKMCIRDSFKGGHFRYNNRLAS